MASGSQIVVNSLANNQKMIFLHPLEALSGGEDEKFGE